MSNLDHPEIKYRKEQDAKEAVKALSNFINNFSCPMEEFALEIMNEHRTLQQSTMRLFMTIIEKWSQQQNFDLRNEATINLCQRIMEAVKDNKYLPYI